MGGSVHSVAAMDFKSDQALWTISLLFAMSQHVTSLDLLARFFYFNFLCEALLVQPINRTSKKF